MERNEVELLIKNENLYEFIRSIDKLRYITRFATAPRSAKESVAEHSFYVASYVLKLSYYYNFDVVKAISLALLHDYAEAYISDVPHPIKKQNPVLEEALDKAEEKVLVEHLSSEMAKLISHFNNGDTPEGLVCQLADVISVVTYAKYELELGNSSYMKQVFQRTKDRYFSLIEKLEPYAIYHDEDDSTIDELTYEKRKKTSKWILSQINDVFNNPLENN